MSVPFKMAKLNIPCRVFGATGSGKSAVRTHVPFRMVGELHALQFLAALTGMKFYAGHGLRSATRLISVVQSPVDDIPCCFVDTPGFDDTSRSDAEVFRMIAEYLVQECVARLIIARPLTKPRMRHDRFVTGIIHMHRISDNRFGGGAAKTMRLLHAMCGADAMRHMVICTTMWDLVDLKEGARREGRTACRVLAAHARRWGDMRAPLRLARLGSPGRARPAC